MLSDLGERMCCAEDHGSTSVTCAFGHMWDCAQERLNGDVAGPCNMQGWLRMHVHWHTVRVHQHSNRECETARTPRFDVFHQWPGLLAACQNGPGVLHTGVLLKLSLEMFRRRQTNKVSVLSHCQPACCWDYMCKGQQGSEPKQNGHMWQICPDVAQMLLSSAK